LAKIHQKLPPVRVRGGKMIFRIIALDSSQGVFTVTFFNNKYAYQAIEINKEYIFHGKLSGSYLRPEIVSPIFMQNSPDVKMQPIYSLTSGLTNKMIASNIKTALSSIKDISATSLPSEIIDG
jgi:ATP-dependent DNA helicase RecG